MTDYLLPTFGIVLAVTAIGACAFWYYQTRNASEVQVHDSVIREKIRTEDEAIQMVQDSFPNLKDYPSDRLPPKSIKAARGDTAWYVAFIQEGSGVPIVSAQCYSVDDQQRVVKIGAYDHASDTDPKTKGPAGVLEYFSPQICAFERD